MDTDFNKIDDLIRDKFEAFTPTPPAHVWEGVEKGIDSAPAALFFTKTRITTAAIILLAGIIGSYLIWNPFSEVPENDGSNIPIEEIIITDRQSESTIETQESDLSPDDSNLGTSGNNNMVLEITEETKPEKKKETKKKSISIVKPLSSGDEDVKDTISEIEDPHSIVTYYMSTLDMRDNFTLQVDDQDYYYPLDRKTTIQNNTVEFEVTPSKSKSSWKTGFYLSPELIVSNIDSVEILNSYSISIEPTFSINKHWFIRSGIGLSYNRDRGFARLEYVVKEYMGSYDDVYDITFDTVSGDVLPVYHTKTVEVWDTVNHISVSNITNSYIYLQIPALLGYSFQASGSPVSWYILGGPAINFKTSSWIEEPKPDEDDADIIELHNNLPIRANSYFQLWFGAGLEYEINRKLSFAVEPGYRHYLSNIYTNTDNKGPSSGFSLRVGLVYKMK